MRSHRLRRRHAIMAKPLEQMQQNPPLSGVWPDTTGHFGTYGGRFVSETLMPALEELEVAWRTHLADPTFIKRLDQDLATFVGRPSPIYWAENLTRAAGGARILLKREDLNHTGAHKINNTVGQALLAQAMGKRRVIAETGAGQHGVASATVAARLGMECIVYMGADDIERQSPNVFRMKLMGAEVVSVDTGSRTLKDALNEAMRDWVTNVDNTFYILGTAAGPHPYPAMVRDFNAVVGREARRQMLEQYGALPDALVACVGGGSNALGLFHPFIEDESVDMVGVEAAGRGLSGDEHSATLCAGRVGVLHGSRTYLLDDDAGQIRDTYSVSAGLDYPGVGPEHAWLKDTGRARYVGVDDQKAMEAFHMVSRTEGIIPALETAHGLAYGIELAATMSPDQTVLINLSGRGDKDINTVAQLEGISL